VAFLASDEGKCPEFLSQLNSVMSHNFNVNSYNSLKCHRSTEFPDQKCNFSLKKLYKILRIHCMTFHKMVIPAFTAGIMGGGYVVPCTSCTVAGSDEFTEIKLVFRSCKEQTWTVYMIHLILM